VSSSDGLPLARSAPKPHILGNVHHRNIAQLFLDREFASRAADSGIAPANLIDARYPRLNLYESRFLSS
jgi:hypothetical protein